MGDVDVERHDSDEPVCVGQWCCGCDEHPSGKPWGWNWQAWERHNRENVEAHGLRSARSALSPESNPEGQ